MAILLLRGLKQEHLEFKISLDYIMRPCLKKKRKRVNAIVLICLTAN